MPYVPPHLRKRVAAAAAPMIVNAVDTSSEALFPSLGGVRVAPTLPRPNFQNLSWKESTQPDEEARHAERARQSLEEGRAALRCFFLSAPPPKPYIRNDDRYEAYLAEQDYLDALKYEAENPLPHQPIVEEWTHRPERAAQAPKQLVMDDWEPESEPEMTEAEIRERITFVSKRLRRNGILREDREAYENELRELQRALHDE